MVHVLYGNPTSFQHHAVTALEQFKDCVDGRYKHFAAAPKLPLLVHQLLFRAPYISHNARPMYRPNLQAAT
jgi:hypothetical protein